MKHITVGILAHVDAGKTTLSEALLYESGRIRALGRVDNKDAYLDTHSLERKRGITIFSKQAILEYKGTRMDLLDTPGHMDFSAEMERTLSVLDMAVLVISGTDGLQSHTETILTLLARHRLPVFIFINKMDVSSFEKTALLGELNEILEGRAVDFTDKKNMSEAAATADDQFAEVYLNGEVTKEDYTKAIAERRIFPCFFGSALKNDGVSDLLSAIDRYTTEKHYPDEFGAIVYKISFDPQGNRLTHLKVTGGTLSVKQLLGEGEKVNEIRLYSGIKYETANSIKAGTVCAVTGISSAVIGTAYGIDRQSMPPLIEPVLTYRVVLPIDVDPTLAFNKLRILEAEDPQLKIAWDSELKEIHLKLMGNIQIEILESIIEERFGFLVSFTRGSILYRETIESEVHGAGHFEPLRHYAEVHLKLEPLPRGSGIQLKSSCSRDILPESYQNLVLSHLLEREHTGVLTNSPITDMQITLTKGRAHPKHTEGGDFREATFRALRQALLKAKSILLEPYYNFKIELPTENLGRALTDINRMHGRYEPPETTGDTSTLKGAFPVSTGQEYQSELLHYTKGRGKLALTFGGYDKCHNPDEVIRERGYDPLSDMYATGHSVFCEHGSGYTVPWNESDRYMHMPVLSAKEGEQEGTQVDEHYEGSQGAKRRATPTDISDDELIAIYERTYGKIKRDPLAAVAKRAKPKQTNPSYTSKNRYAGQEYMLVDGYNIIFAWDELKALAADGIDAARYKLMDILCNFAAYKDLELILVFDAYKVKGGLGFIEKYYNITVVYTKEKETADMYIEKVTHTVARTHKVTVATSDRLEQMIIWGHGALRMPANELYYQVKDAEQSVRSYLENR